MSSTDECRGMDKSTWKPYFSRRINSLDLLSRFGLPMNTPFTHEYCEYVCGLYEYSLGLLLTFSNDGPNHEMISPVALGIRQPLPRKGFSNR